MWIIYGLRLQGSSEYRYVGLSRNSPEKKLKGHKDTARRFLDDHRPVMNWLRKHLYTVTLDVLEECPEGDIEFLKFRECFWIASLKQFGHSLLNLTEGGDGAVLYERTEEWRQSHSKFMSGSGNPMYGKNHSAETRKRMSQAQTGKKFSDEHRQKLSEVSKILCSGEGNPAAKLTADQVREIRSLISIKTTKELAAEYGVSVSSILQIKNRKTWKNI
jgi:group I intron endonuclease